MRAVKGNKEYTIGEGQKKSYQDSGFDILDDDGKVIAYGRGKTVPYDDYMRVVKENERLKAEAGTVRAAKPEQPKKAESKKAGD